MSTAESPTEEAAPLRLVLHLDVAPRPGQTHQEATAEMAALVAEYLTEDDKPFFEDYGARASDLEAFHQDGESPSWGGYEGPFVTGARVSGNAGLLAESDW